MQENINILSWCQKRETKSSINIKFQRQFHVNFPFARRLGLEKELEGHTGCVNCLQWSDSEEILASGSDDFNIIIWDILRRKPKTIVQSGHQGNIFAVQFLPYTQHNNIASAAADATVRVNCVTTGECTKNYQCHVRRIKRLAASKQSPNLLWSGSEDGTVRQFDLREPHQCQHSKPCSNVLIDVTAHIGPASEVKCIQIHPLYPEYIAVGCSDPFVRLYDRRMLCLTESNNSKPKENTELQPPPGCVAYFAPGHLPVRAGRVRVRKHKHYVTTFTNFSPDGTELIQNLGGEHIYIYDINKKRKPLVFSSSSHECNNMESNHCHKCENKGQNGISRARNGFHKNDHKNGYGVGSHSLTSTYDMRHERTPTCSSKELCDEALELKLKGNDAFSQENYFQAVVCYNNALKLVPDSSVLYANRAAALLKRRWDGDIYSALRDSQVAVSLDSTHSKAYYRQARCLFELKWYVEANECLKRFKERFPDLADGFSIRKLEMEISQYTKHMSTNTPVDQTGHHNDNTSPRHNRSSSNTTSDEERYRRENSRDYECRFIGSCNTTTDIKEANFFGNDGQFVIAGSDCGCMLLWERATTNLIEAWQGDESIVNCLQPHPTSCLVATSGIDPVVRLWSPRSAEKNENDTRAKEVEGLVRSNQKRMNTDPLEEMLRTMGYRAAVDVDSDGEGEGEGGDDTDPSSVQCRTS